MKYLMAGLLLIFWIAASIILVITILGLVVLIDEESAWMDFPKKLLDVFKS